MEFANVGFGYLLLLGAVLALAKLGIGSHYGFTGPVFIRKNYRGHFYLVIGIACFLLGIPFAGGYLKLIVVL